MVPTARGNIVHAPGAPKFHIMQKTNLIRFDGLGNLHYVCPYVSLLRCFGISLPVYSDALFQAP